MDTILASHPHTTLRLNRVYTHLALNHIEEGYLHQIR